MNTSGLTYGEASEVADYLSSASGISQESVVSVLVNAMNRIARLEAELARVRAVQQGRTIPPARKMNRP